MKFSTKDRDNDDSSRNCAREMKGGWWYKECSRANLNGEYILDGETDKPSAITWDSWKGPNYSLETVVMKIRPYEAQL